MKPLPYGLRILYEDRDVLAVDKPAGLLSIAAGAERDKTAYWILSEYLRRKGEKRRAAAVHRLDRDTSGAMLFVKSGQVKRIMMEHWDQIAPERRYAAVAEGVFAESAGLIDAPLGPDKNGKMQVTPEGQRAITRWKVRQTGKNYTLLALELETGRRNQIRAHLAYIRHPVAGDLKYHARTNPLNRLALHAELLGFYHPRTGQYLLIESPIPKPFLALP
ncbi:MAG: RluA family pseudouridine synthase [Spirochaetaceae bacterium]|jgi:23S rRNA pseudouridine1911/1915/1917 synthase|nr:RluA family pseudouridine synthase [Spirochaetaceae bacterium]